MTLDQADYVEKLKSMMARHPDPELHSAIWDYREGKISRRDLQRHPAFGAAMNADTARMKAELEARGFTPERLHDKLVGELTSIGLYPPEPGQPDIVAEPEDDR